MGKSADSATRPVLVADNISKSYRHGDTEVHALREVTFEVFPGQVIAIVGPLGSGRTTLLNCLSGILPASTGTVLLGGVELTSLPPDRQLRVRSLNVGFIRSGVNLLPSKTIEQNILLGPDLAGRPRSPAVLDAVVQHLNLDNLLPRAPWELSPTEQQRAVLARSLASQTGVILADEPTLGLNSSGVQELLSALRGASQVFGTTVILTTADLSVGSWADRTLILENGQILEAPASDVPANLADDFVRTVGREARDSIPHVESRIHRRMSKEQAEILEQATRILKSLPGTLPEALDNGKEPPDETPRP